MLRDWASNLDAKDFVPSVIHPTTLDSLLQIPLVVTTKGGSHATPILAASSTEELLISASLLEAKDALELTLHARNIS